MYSNNFFDLTFEFPKDWIPHGEATKQHIMEIGKDKLVAAIPGSEAAVRIAEKHGYNLLTVFENELGTPGVKYFRSEVLFAEDVSWAPGIKTGKDYLLNALPLLKKEGYDRFSEIKQVDIGDKTFYREDLSKQERTGIRGYQAYFATIARGYALSLIISTEDSDETGKLAESPALHFGPRLARLEAARPDRDAMPSDPRESGSVSSGLYHNNYFEMSYRLPEGWYADTNIFKRRLKDAAASGPIVTLLAANEFVPGTPGIEFNPFMLITAYSSAGHGRAMTAEEYLSLVTRAAREKEHAELIRQGPGMSVGTQKFYRADYKRREIGYKAVVCTIWKENVLAWTFVGRSQLQLDELVARFGVRLSLKVPTKQRCRNPPRYNSCFPCLSRRTRNSGPTRSVCSSAPAWEKCTVRATPGFCVMCAQSPSGFVQQYDPHRLRRLHSGAHAVATPHSY